MPVFSPWQLADYRRVQERYMQDTALLHAYSAAVANGYGNPSATYAAGVETICGYKPTSTDEVQEGNDTVIVDGELRLPRATVISHLDRIELTHRFAELLAPPLWFEIVGQPAIGPSGLVAKIRSVTNGE